MLPAILKHLHPAQSSGRLLNDPYHKHRILSTSLSKLTPSAPPRLPMRNESSDVVSSVASTQAPLKCDAALEETCGSGWCFEPEMLRAHWEEQAYQFLV